VALHDCTRNAANCQTRIAPRYALPQLCCATHDAREETPQPPDCFTDTNRTKATRDRRTDGHTAKQALNEPMATELPQEPGGWGAQRGFARLDRGRFGNADTQRQVPRTPKDVSAAMLARGEFALAPAATCVDEGHLAPRRLTKVVATELNCWRTALPECAA
jgi:hypothetical protein